MTTVVSLVDTNVLVYRFDIRDPEKRRAATSLLRRGAEDGSLKIPHQALVEFVAAVTRPLRGGPILGFGEALAAVEELIVEFEILYPTRGVVLSALRGSAAYGLSWYDAHLWAYADHYGLPEILSEDFQHGRLYGSVRAVNPFIRAGRRG